MPATSRFAIKMSVVIAVCLTGLPLLTIAACNAQPGSSSLASPATTSDPFSPADEPADKSADDSAAGAAGAADSAQAAKSALNRRRETARLQADVVFALQMLRWAKDNHKALRMDRQQADRAKALSEQMKEPFAGMRTLSPEAREKELREKWIPAAATIRQQLNKILTPAQITVLHNVVFRNQVGEIAFLSPEAIALLKYTPEQQRKIEDYAATTIYEFDPTSRAAALEFFEMVARAKRQYRTVFDDVLTASQRETWQDAQDKGR